MNKRERTVFNSGVFNKKDLNRDYIEIKDHLYVAPRKKGAYLGMTLPNRTGEQISTLLEIHYSNPELFIDYFKTPQEIKEGEIGQEALWMGKKPLRLRKIKDVIVNQPSRDKQGSKPLKYRYIITEVEDDKIRSPMPAEYGFAITNFKNRYHKEAVPDTMNSEEKKFFYDQIEMIVKKNDSLNKIGGNLEKILLPLIIVTFFGSIFFLFPSVTGNIIGNLFSVSRSFIGIILFILSLICCFIRIKKLGDCYILAPKRLKN